MTAPTMDERRAVALRMRGYDCPVLPSQQTTREAVDAVVECMGLEDDEEMCTVRHFLDRLADLIDPGEGMDEDGRDGLEILKNWPRFEDGEPVRFLDDFERYGDENSVSVVTMYSDGSFALNFRAYSKGERVNRPAPKVLDADGAEIRVGDRLYDTDTGCGRTVRAVNDNGTVEFDGHKNRGWFGKFFTHRAPVLAADGKPLRVGDTVWYANGDSPQLKVVRVEGDRVVTTNARDGEQWWAAYILTHEQPDSWERLERDAGKNPFDYCKDVGYRLDTCENSEAYKARDLVRRARALAERGQ